MFGLNIQEEKTIRLLFTLEAVCSVPNNLYHKLQARRASIWKLNPDDENIVRNLIN